MAHKNMKKNFFFKPDNYLYIPKLNFDFFANEQNLKLSEWKQAAGNLLSYDTHMLNHNFLIAIWPNESSVCWETGVQS